MSWVKLDDGFPDHPKVADLSVAARWAYVEALCYCARFLTDGLIPKGQLAKMGTAKVRGELITAGLWDEGSGGIQVHDFLEYNPTRESVLTKRAADSARKSAGVAAASNRPVPPPLPLPDPVLEKPTVSNQGGGGRANIFILYEQVFGPMHGGVIEELGAIEDEYPPACVEHCFKAAQDLVPRPKSLGWVKAMLGRHQRDGCDKAGARKVAEPALKGRYD